MDSTFLKLWHLLTPDQRRTSMWIASSAGYIAISVELQTEFERLFHQIVQPTFLARRKPDTGNV